MVSDENPEYIYGADYRQLHSIQQPSALVQRRGAGGGTQVGGGMERLGKLFFFSAGLTREKAGRESQGEELDSAPQTPAPHLFLGSQLGVGPVEQWHCCCPWPRKVLRAKRSGAWY